MDFVKEQPTALFTGTGAYTLNGAYSDGDLRCRDAYDTAAPIEFLARTLASSPNGVKREEGIGTLTTGSPDQLSRDTIYLSTNSNNKVDWQSTDVFVIFCAPLLRTLLPRRPLWTSIGQIGAANGPTNPLSKNDIGAVFELSVAASNRTFTIGTALASLPTFFRFGIVAYGHASNTVAVTPNAADGINGGTAGTAYNVTGNIGIKWFTKNPLRSNVWLTE